MKRVGRAWCLVALTAGSLLAGRAATAQGTPATPPPATPPAASTQSPATQPPSTPSPSAAAPGGATTAPGPSQSGTPHAATAVALPTTAAVAASISADSVPAMRAPVVAATVKTPAPGPAPAVPSPLPNGGSLPLDRVVAVVGTEPVLWSSVLERINVGRAQGNLQIPSDSLGQVQLARTVANDLINEELLVQKAKELKVEVTDEDVAPGVDQKMKQVRSGFPSEVEYRNELKKAGFGTPEEYRKSLLETAKRSELQRRVIDKLKEDGKLIPVGVSEADITNAFNTNKASLPRRPATVTFRQVVIAPRPTPAAKAAAKAKADSVLAELKAHGSSAEDFAEVAKRESMDQGTREQGGDLGWNRRGTMVLEFDRWMFALPPGQLSPVIETVFGYHIIRVDRVKPAEVKASHILIRWKLDSSQVDAAKVEADSVLSAWKAGASFDSLVAHHHDPNEEKGSLQPFPRDSLPPSYSEAFRGKKSGEFAGPFPIVDRGTGKAKYVVAQVINSTEGGDYTMSDLRDRIRDQLADERAIARLLDGLRKETYVTVRL
jgi:peptidyl-prolyl cis-trans isomerase SurA